jgi:hypothetical protein
VIIDASTGSGHHARLWCPPSIARRPSEPEAAVVSDTDLALIARLEPRINELARRISREYFAHLPGYDELPGDMVRCRSARTARRSVRSRPVGGRRLAPHQRLQVGEHLRERAGKPLRQRPVGARLAHSVPATVALR